MEYPVIPKRSAAGLMLLLAISIPASGQKPPPVSPGAAIDALIQPLGKAGLISGVILVAKGNMVLFQHGYGFSSWELGSPNGASTRFGIASITKDMTNIIVDALVSEGRLDLDAPVSRYLPGFPSGPGGGIPTIRHLLEHKAGVPFRVTSAADETVPLQLADIVARVQEKGLLFDPGTKELYSSAGYSCLARVIEVVEQLRFDSILARRIFRPASMSRATDETRPLVMTGRAEPYLLGIGSGRVAAGAAPYKDLHFLGGAGSVYATALDMLHFIQALRTGALGAAAQRQFADSADTWRSWYGRTNGYEASVDYLPKRELTFVLLTNLQSAATAQVRQQVKHLLLGQPTTSIPQPPPVAARSEDVTAAIGFYGDPNDPVEVSLVGGRLLRDGNEFYPIGGGKYYILASGAVLHFIRRADGTVESMATKWPTGQEANWPKVR